MNQPSTLTPAESTVSPAATPAKADPSAFDIRLNAPGFDAPWKWLRLGWRDFMRAPGIGVFYGACFAAMGWMLLWLFQHAPAYTLALSAGFLLMGPFLCLGLYDVSRRLERGDKPGLVASLTAWRDRTGTMAIFGAVLLILEMLWARASLIVFALSFDGMPDFKGSLLALLDPGNIGFIVGYLVVAALFGGLIFAISVVAMPMILDRQTDAITAGLTSLRLCLAEPDVMLLWALLIALITALAMLPWFLGLLLAAPVIGHASWHAYRGAVRPEAADLPRP